MSSGIKPASFVGFLRSMGGRVTDAQLQESFGKDYEALVPIINDFLSRHRLQAFTTADGSMEYRLVEEEVAATTADLAQDDLLVLQAIESSGDRGMWIRTLKAQTHLQTTAINKILKRLESRRLVKSVKSVTHKNRKMYMLYEIEPSKELTGGAWYTEQELDTVLIEAVRKIVYREVKAGPKSVRMLTERVARSGVVRVALGAPELRQIVDTLVFDGKLEPVVGTADADGDVGMGGASLVAGAGLDTLYRVTREVTLYTSYAEAPCGVCAVRSACRPGGDISPEGCVYLTKWMEF
jgi:DNA-directed RNA polymerase III subunit RPC6